MFPSIPFAFQTLSYTEKEGPDRETGMEKSCVNHPESHALATCKACEKSICLMCVVDEKEGTFCSPECHKLYCEVSDWASPGSSPAPSPEAAPAPATAAAPVSAPASAAPPAPEPAPSPKGESIFDAEPQPAAATEPASYEPLVAPGTKWRMIGAMCAAHVDTPAVATCDRCTKTLCGLCLTERPEGTFCVECASAAPQPEAEEQAIRQAARAPAPPPKPAARPRPRRSSPAARVAAVAVLLAALGGGTWLYLDLKRREEAALSPDSRPAATAAPTPAPRPPQPRREPAPPPPPRSEAPAAERRAEVPPPQPPAPPRVEEPAPKAPEPKKVPPAEPGPQPPPPPPQPAPAPDPFLFGRISNPWEREPEGSWYRIRRAKNGQVVYTDVGLKSKSPASYILRTQTRSAEGDQPPREEPVELVPYLVKGEETLEIEGRKFLCEIQESRAGEATLRSWVLVEGIHAGAVLKRISPEGKLEARRVWEHALRIQGRNFDCLVIEADLATPQGVRPIKTWYCSAVPIRKLREETPEESMAVVDLGDDWSHRPPISR